MAVAATLLRYAADPPGLIMADFYLSTRLPAVLMVLCLHAALLPKPSHAEPGQSDAVRTLFEARCAACHDSARGGTKGDFGHILDLSRLQLEKDVVVPGDPENSLLYELCAAGEMPPKPPVLTRSETARIHRWIMTMEDLPPSPPLVETEGSPIVVEPTALRLWHWAGRFHPVAVHFPVAMLIGAALAEALQVLRRRVVPHPASRFCLAVGAWSGILAALLGWAYADPWQHDLLLEGLHRWSGTAVAAVAAVAWWRCRRVDSDTPTRRVAQYRVVVALAAVAVGIVGLLGGALHYGFNHYAW